MNKNHASPTSEEASENRIDQKEINNEHIDEKNVDEKKSDSDIATDNTRRSIKNSVASIAVASIANMYIDIYDVNS